MTTTVLDDLPSNLQAPKKAKAPPKKPAPRAAAASTATTPAKAKTTRIILNENPLIPSSGLPIGHNGRTFMLRTGEPADVPQEVLTVLNDAVTSAPQVENGAIVGWRDQQQYPYRVVG